MPTEAVIASDPTLAKVRAVLEFDGMNGQAGETVLHLQNAPGAERRLFQSAAVDISGPYSVSVATEDSFFLCMRPDGDLHVHVGPSTGATTARFAIGRIDGFEYHLSRNETKYTFIERHPRGETRLGVRIRW